MLFAMRAHRTDAIILSCLNTATYNFAVAIMTTYSIISVKNSTSVWYAVKNEIGK